MWLLNLKIHFHPKRKNSHGRILKRESKEQHVSTIPKSCSLSLSLSLYIYIYIHIYIKCLFLGECSLHDCFWRFFFRFILLRGSSGFYSYAIYEHLKDWPDFDIGETRITFKLRKDKYTYFIHYIYIYLYISYKISCIYF